MVHAGTTYHVTRTTIGRMFLLAPSPVVNRVIRFCLFRAAAIYEVQVHWVVVESNHFHAGVTDIRGNISRFMAWFDGMVAKNLVAHYEQTRPNEYLDAIWSKDHFNAVVLPNAEAVMKAMAYDLTNPVKDGLVHDYRQWPGLISRPGDWLKPKERARRVDGLFFSSKDKLSRYVDVKYTVPPVLAGRKLELRVDDMNALIRDSMKNAWTDMSLKKRSFLGVKGVLAVDPFESPQTPRLKGKRTPSFAAGGDTALLKEGLTLLRNFRKRYREAWTELRNGVRDVVFPAGTYLLRTRFGVTCDVLHPPWCIAAT